MYRVDRLHGYGFRLRQTIIQQSEGFRFEPFFCFFVLRFLKIARSLHIICLFLLFPLVPCVHGYCHLGPSPLPFNFHLFFNCLNVAAKRLIHHRGTPQLIPLARPLQFCAEVSANNQTLNLTPCRLPASQRDEAYPGTLGHASSRARKRFLCSGLVPRTILQHDTICLTLAWPLADARTVMAIILRCCAWLLCRSLI